MKDTKSEEIFFLIYHLGWSVQSARSIKEWERRWIIERFIEQRGKDGKRDGATG